VSRVARAGGLSLVGAGVAAVTGIALTALITNGFDRATAGTIFATTSLFLIATAVVQLGTEVGLVRSLPALVVRSEHDHLRSVVGVAVLPVLAASSLCALLGYVLAPQLAALIGPGGEVPPRGGTADVTSLVDQIRILALLLPVAAVYNVVLAATRGLRTMVPTVALEAFVRSIVQLAAVAMVLLVGLGAVAVVLAWSLPYALGLALAVGWLTTLLRRATASDGESGTTASRRGSMAAFWRFTAPRALGTTSQVILKRADIVLVAALRSPEEAALYAAATRFVVLGQLGVQALQQALSPHLSALFARDDYAGASDAYRATTAWSMLLAWPVYLSCAVLAAPLLGFFGPGYDEVAPVVVMLSVAMLAATACGAVDTVLLMSGRAWLSLGNNSAALVLNLVLNVALIPRFGAVGAGAAWTVSIIVRNLLPLIQIRRVARLSPLGRETLLVASLSITCFGAAPWVLRALSAPTGLIVTGLGVGAALFLALVWWFRRELALGAFAGMLRTPPAGRCAVSSDLSADRSSAPPPTRSRRRSWVLGGLLACIGLVGAGAVTLIAPWDNPVPVRHDTNLAVKNPTRPPTTNERSAAPRYGASFQLERSESYESALARTDYALGRLDVVRVFYPGAPDPWPGKAPGRDVVVSFKLDPRAVLAGDHDQDMRAWFESAPRALDVHWVYWHEPEDEVEGGSFTAAQFRDAFARLDGLADETGNPRLESTVVLMSWSTREASGRDWRDYFPPRDTVDVLAWDVYNRRGDRGHYSTPIELLDAPRKAAESVGKPFAIAELGSVLIDGDDGAGRAQWLRSMGAYLSEYRAVFVTYFNFSWNDGVDDYRLRDRSSRLAWRELGAAARVVDPQSRQAVAEDRLAR